MKMRFLLPLIFFLFLVAVLWRGLGLHPNQIPSPLVDKPAPAFQLQTLANPKKMTSNKDFIGHVTLVNVWATWCFSCAEEHDFLLNLIKKENLFLYGLNYKDDPIAAKDWLKKRGNPYNIIASDETGSVAIDWGVYGTPETFVVDKKGIIRYKHIGAITADIWEKDLQPLVNKLRGES